MSMPVIVYTWDHFQRPYLFAPNVVVSIDEVFEQKIDALHCHVSQMYEWLPYNDGSLAQVPEGEKERRAWLREFRAPRFRRAAELYREMLVAGYGEERGQRVEFAEAFEACEYGAPLTAVARRRLFPFVG
jgi:LmbE family N-acetylglucosaminyl deacetylase